VYTMMDVGTGVGEQEECVQCSNTCCRMVLLAVNPVAPVISSVESKSMKIRLYLEV
jgi:hypothetical protein